MNHPHDDWLDNFGQTLSDVLVERVENNIISGDVFDAREIDIIRDELLAKMPGIDMVLHCPACGLQHIDGVEQDPRDDPRHLATSGWAIFHGPKWTNPPHRSHLCRGCQHVWRPADVPTNGVQAVKTKGKNDSKIVKPGCLNCATAICDECAPERKTS